MPHLSRWSPAFGETHDRMRLWEWLLPGGQKASMTQSTSPLLVADSSIARDALLIEDLTFAVGPGEALHVRGENGAGKSMLMLSWPG